MKHIKNAMIFLLAAMLVACATTSVKTFQQVYADALAADDIVVETATSARGIAGNIKFATWKLEFWCIGTLHAYRDPDRSGPVSEDLSRPLGPVHAWEPSAAARPTGLYNRLCIILCRPMRQGRNLCIARVAPPWKLLFHVAHDAVSKWEELLYFSIPTPVENVVHVL